MWQAEVLQRQGSWVTWHRSKTDAVTWSADRERADRNSVNPVKKITVKEASNKPLPHPRRPEKPFDEGGWEP